MLLIYSPQAGNRVKYTFDLIFNSILGIEYFMTHDADYFGQFDGAKINYSKRAIGKEIHIPCTDLLFEKGVTNTVISTFPIEKGAENIEDLFAFSFFLASRYEEYLPFTGDTYGRFSAKQSYSFRNNFLHTPMVNVFAKKIREMIATRYPGFVFPEKKYSFIPTLDIDNAYAYRGKNLTRTLGGYARAIAKSDIADLSKRKNVLSGKEKDPYDTYDFQFEIHKKYNLKPIYFFLLGDWAKNDKNLPHTNSLMQALINKISERAETGIHPSFASDENPEKVELEEKRLREITGKKTTKSRQHFLKLRFPETYRNLIAAGITDDYTMGYADEAGFRAGICSPYKWYDLEKEEETGLTIHPFAVMDGTLNSYLKLSPAESLEKVKSLIREVKNVNGEFITIWHNETLSDWKDWKGWKELYEQILKIAV